MVVWIIQFLLSTIIFSHYKTQATFHAETPSSIPGITLMKTCVPDMFCHIYELHIPFLHTDSSI